MDQPTTTIVVAKYLEDMSWTTKFSKFPIVIFDKSNGGLPNVGREAHTYAYFMWSEYDTLSGSYAFLQGDSPRHFGRREEEIHDALVSNTNGFKGLSNGWYFDYGNGLPYDHRNFNVDIFYSYLTGLEPPAYYVYPNCALFQVTTKRIKEYSKDFYKKLVDMIIEDEHGALIMERLWAELLDHTFCEEVRTSTPLEKVQEASRNVLRKREDYPPFIEDGFEIR